MGWPRLRPSALLLATTLSVAFVTHASAAPAPTTRPARPVSALPWRVHALEYAHSRYPAALINGAPTTRPGARGARRVDFAWLFYLLRAGSRVILVDTGFVGHGWERSLKLSRQTDPRVLLARLGVSPAAVTDVVLTHGHFDHAGGLPLFGRARIWLGHRELRAIAVGARRSGRLRRLHAWLERARRAGRLELVRTAPRSLAAGLTLEQAGGHSPGSTVLWLAQGRRRCVFVGDECYLRAACRRALPLPAASRASLARNRRLLTRIARAMKREGLRVYSAHDPAVLAEGSAVERAAHVVPVCQPTRPSRR